MNRLSDKAFWNRIIVYGLLVAAVCVLIAAFIPFGSTATSDKVLVRGAETEVLNAGNAVSPTVAAEVAIAPDVGNVTTTAVKTFTKNTNQAINRLITNYIGTIVAGDQTELARYVDSVADMDALTLRVYGEYVERVTNLDCYVMTGMLPDTYIVAATYTVKFIDIETSISNMEYYYVCTDASGNLYITNKAVSDEVAAYNELMYKSSIITDLAKEIAGEYDAQLKSDPALVELMSGIANLR